VSGDQPPEMPAGWQHSTLGPLDNPGEDPRPETRDSPVPRLAGAGDGTLAEVIERLDRIEALLTALTRRRRGPRQGA
jgi:hypothetical protein